MQRTFEVSNTQSRKQIIHPGEPAQLSVIPYKRSDVKGVDACGMSCAMLPGNEQDTFVQVLVSNPHPQNTEFLTTVRFVQNTVRQFSCQFAKPLPKIDMLQLCDDLFVMTCVERVNFVAKNLLLEQAKRTNIVQ